MEEKKKGLRLIYWIPTSNNTQKVLGPVTRPSAHHGQKYNNSVQLRTEQETIIMGGTKKGSRGGIRLSTNNPFFATGFHSRLAPIDCRHQEKRGLFICTVKRGSTNNATLVAQPAHNGWGGRKGSVAAGRVGVNEIMKGRESGSPGGQFNGPRVGERKKIIPERLETKWVYSLFDRRRSHQAQTVNRVKRRGDMAGKARLIEGKILHKHKYTFNLPP